MPLRVVVGRLFADTETGEMTAHFAKPLLGDSQLQLGASGGRSEVVKDGRGRAQCVSMGCWVTLSWSIHVDEENEVPQKP